MMNTHVPERYKTIWDLAMSAKDEQLRKRLADLVLQAYVELRLGRAIYLVVSPKPPPAKTKDRKGLVLAYTRTEVSE